MVTPSARGSPITMREAIRCAVAPITSSTSPTGTMARRMLVHFCPALTVISVTSDFTNASNSGVSATASGPRMDALSESVSLRKRTPPETTPGCWRSLSAVEAEPVKATRSR